MINQLLKFFNSIQLHYGKLNSVNERDIHLFDEKALIKLSIKHGSVEKIFESLILKYEKGVDINEEYINKVFSEYKIDIDQANSLLSKLKQPKEPSFSKKALLKTPDFSKSKFEEIAKPSFSNTSKSQNKIENDKVNGNPKNTANKKNKTLKEHWNSWSNVQKIGYVVLCIVIFGVFSNIFNSSGSTNSTNLKNSSIESYPSGVSTACFCADYFNGANSYGQSPSQKQKCRKMYICLDNAMVDCMGGTSSVWTRCEPIY